MLLFNMLGLLVAISRFCFWTETPGTVLMNVVWCMFNVILLGVCTAVAREMKQVRTTVRVNFVTPLTLHMEDGRMLDGATIDMSSGGGQATAGGGCKISARGRRCGSSFLRRGGGNGATGDGGFVRGIGAAITL